MKVITLLLLFITPIAMFAEHDSVNRYTATDLVFENAFEESAYKQLMEPGDHDYLAAAFTAGINTDEESYLQFAEQFNKTIQRIRAHKHFSKKPKKQINYIFETIHDEYFKLYRENPKFSDIQKNGDFNCLTASILYGIAFEQLGIPYEIKILPQHAYVVAYPNAESQLVETTNPLRGTTIIYNRKDKYKMVNELVDFKLVSREEVDEKGVDQVFSDNYLGEESLKLKAGIGALYLNAAIDQLGHYHYVEAYELFKKSSVLYPKKTTNIMLLSTAAAIVEFRDYESDATFSAIADMEKFGYMGIPENLILDEFIVFAGEMVNDNSFSKVDSVYTYLVNRLASESLKEEISVIYYYDKAVFLEQQEDLFNAWINLEKAGEINPDDEDIKSYLPALFFKIFQQEDDSEVLFQLLDSMDKQDCIIVGEDWFVRFQKGLYLDLMNKKYSDEEFESAEELRMNFEERFPPDQIQDYMLKRYLVQIYSMAAMRYFRRNKESRTKAVLESGLKYAPESIELLSKMEALKY